MVCGTPGMMKSVRAVHHPTDLSYDHLGARGGIVLSPASRVQLVAGEVRNQPFPDMHIHDRLASIPHTFHQDALTSKSSFLTHVPECQAARYQRARRSAQSGHRPTRLRPRPMRQISRKRLGNCGLA